MYCAFTSRVAGADASMCSGVSITGTQMVMFSASPTFVPGFALARIA